jgi:hypothetical protein
VFRTMSNGIDMSSSQYGAVNGLVLSGVRDLRHRKECNDASTKWRHEDVIEQAAEIIHEWRCKRLQATSRIWQIINNLDMSSDTTMLVPSRCTIESSFFSGIQNISSRLITVGDSKDEVIPTKLLYVHLRTLNGTIGYASLGRSNVVQLRKEGMLGCLSVG